jgi:hypothetical protein
MVGCRFNRILLNVVPKLRHPVLDCRVGNQNFTDRVRKGYGYGLGITELAAVVIEFRQAKDVPRNLLDIRFAMLDVDPKRYWHVRSIVRQ